MSFLSRKYNKIVKIGECKFVRRNLKWSFYMYDLFMKIKDLDGDIVECGIGRAETFMVFAKLSEFYGKKLWGFDSFEGFPEITKNDICERNPQKGEWAYLCPNDTINILKQTGASDEFIDKDLKLVKGFFKDTLPKTELQKIALLHLDVDLYESYKECLENLYSKVVKGGIIMFDEYNHPKWPTAKIAIDKYLGDKLKEIQYSELGNKYYLKI